MHILYLSGSNLRLAIFIKYKINVIFLIKIENPKESGYTNLLTTGRT